MKFIAFLIVALACIYICSSVRQIYKTLKARKSSASNQNKPDEKEVDQSNSEKN